MSIDPSELGINQMFQEALEKLKSAEVKDGVATLDLSPHQVSLTITSLCARIKHLQEQVRLYELAAERGWIIRPITCDGEIVEWCTAERGEFLDRLLGTGPTPTAAIAAAEKKAGDVG